MNIKMARKLANGEEPFYLCPICFQITGLKIQDCYKHLLYEHTQKEAEEQAFPIAFNEAITAKQTAVQRALEAQNKLEQIKFEAQQAVAKANGDAEAINIINQQLLKSPQYINYLAVNKWDGKMPLATGGILPFVNIPLQ